MYGQRKPKRIVDQLLKLSKKTPKCPVLEKQMKFTLDVSVI